MHASMELNISNCTRDPETCPVLEKVFEFDTYESQIEYLDPSAAERRQVLGSYFILCARGICPGQDPRLANLFIERKQNETPD